MKPEDFKEGTYIKCIIEPALGNPVTKGKIYKVEKLDFYYTNEYSEYLGVHIYDDNNHLIIVKIFNKLFKVKKMLVFELKNLFIPKIEICKEVVHEEINFVIATDIEVYAQKYNL